MAKNDLLLTLTPLEPIAGLGKDVTGVELAVKVGEPELIQPGVDMLIKIRLQINSQKEEVLISQQVSYDRLVENIISLEGSLWVLGKSSDISIEHYTVELFYTPKK